MERVIWRIRRLKIKTHMKKSFIAVLFLGLISACTPEYITKDPIHGTPIVIRDRESIIENALALGVDSVCVVSNSTGNYSPIDWMNENSTTLFQDTLENGSVIAGSITYRVVYTKNLIEK
jgi:hypothetical protein